MQWRQYGKCNFRKLFVEIFLQQMTNVFFQIVWILPNIKINTFTQKKSITQYDDFKNRLIIRYLEYIYVQTKVYIIKILQVEAYLGFNITPPTP